MGCGRFEGLPTSSALFRVKTFVSLTSRKISESNMSVGVRKLFQNSGSSVRIAYIVHAFGMFYVQLL